MSFKPSKKKRYKKVFEAANVTDFDPAQTFDCGQCFRWEMLDADAWEGIAGCGGEGRKARLAFDAEKGELRVFELLSEDAEHSEDAREGRGRFWRNYLDLDRDYAGIKSILSDGDEVMARAISFGGGIRILNQDKWETIVSFIISQNNNIPRIKRCIHSIAENFGGPEGSLPDVETMAALSAEDLEPCKLGYRAKYLIKAAAQVKENGLPEHPEQLRGLCGVGPKVADCIALFGLGHVDSFPVDVWMKRAMNELYGIPADDVSAMQAYAAEHFAPYGGIAQQYLFYYITHKDTNDTR